MNPESTTAGNRPAKGKRVLIVEDDPLIAMDLAAWLEESGWLVLGPAGTVRQAIELLARDTVAIALLDINLGHEDSSSVAQLLTEKHVPIVYLTGDLRHAREMRGTARPTLAKPVDYRELGRVLDATLRDV